jgi:hypothetical protein
MADGKLWVHSPAEPTEEVCRELEELGEVAWIVVPNRFHHLNAPAMKLKYPDAKIMGPKAARERNSEVVLDQQLDSPQIVSSLAEFQLLPLAGVPFLEETVFFHQPSQTLIGADLMMNGCAKDHFTWRWVARLFGQYGSYKVPPDVRMRTRPNSVLKESLDRLASLPIKKILVAHSDPITESPVEQLKQAWRFIGA